MNPETLQWLQAQSPCYVYEEQEILNRAAELKNAFADYQLLFSVKTNPFMPVIRTLAGCGFGADAASAGEVALARKCGIPAENIYYSVPGRTFADLENTYGECVFIADSLHEIALAEEYAAKYARTLSIGIRLNPAFTMDGAASAPSKFGIDAEKMLDVLALLAKCPHLKLNGVHIHIRSQVLDTAQLAIYYQNCYQAALALSEQLQQPLSYINFGSGIGTVYDALKQSPVDLQKLSNIASDIAAHNKTHMQAKLMIETGRFVTCQSGTFYTPVVDRKESHGKTFVVVRSGLNGFLRPAIAALLESLPMDTVPMAEPFYTTRHAFTFSVIGAEEGTETVTIAGSLCTALDVLADTITLPKAPIGSLIAIGNAGSYAKSLSPHLFSSHPAPKEFLYTTDGKFLSDEK